jgi:hypothetical protein
MSFRGKIWLLTAGLKLALLLMLLNSCTRHYGEASWAIQGIYSQLDCANQPDTRPFYVDGFFLECMR